MWYLEESGSIHFRTFAATTLWKLIQTIAFLQLLWNSASLPPRKIQALQCITIKLPHEMMLLGINSNWNSPIGLRTWKLMKITLYKLPITSWNKLSMRQHQAFSQRKRKNTNKPWVSTQSLDLLNFEELYAKVAKNTVVKNISYMENYHWTRRYSTCEWQNQQNWTNLCRSWRSQ